MSSFRRIEDIAPNQTALVRVDFNVPMADGKVSDDTRLKAALPTIRALQAKNARIALLAHFDRPKGKRVPEMSLKPVVEPLSALLGAPVGFAEDCVGMQAQAAIASLAPGSVVLLENTRFHDGEEKNSAELAAELAQLADVYVNDAFSAAHRAHASTEGVAHRLPAYAGKQMEAELVALDAALGNPKRPVLGIVGGSKVSTKLDLLQNLVGKLDKLAIGGGMANTFLHAQGWDVGASLCEKDLADTARAIMKAAVEAKCELLLPIDVVVAREVAPGAAFEVRAVNAVQPEDKILDAGPETSAKLKQAMGECATLIWNGPLGVFEVPPFDKATMDAAHFAADRAKAGQLIAVAGGGDTVAALNQAGRSGDFTFVSTAGGAFLEWMEGKPLPGVEALKA